VKSFTVGTPTNGTFYSDAAMTKPVTGSIDAVNGEATVLQAERELQRHGELHLHRHRQRQR
jgi:hypothetical protein